MNSEMMPSDKDKHIEVLEVSNNALVEKLNSLTRRKMARNHEAALKWRGKAFYYKRKYEAVIKFLSDKGIETPPLVHMERGAE